MNLTTVDRNRLTVVVLFTVIVSVLYFVSTGRSEGDASDPAAATTTVPGDGTGFYTDPNSVVDAPASLLGPGAAESGGGGPIAFPADEDLNTARGRASFKRYPQGGERGCSTGLAPLATRAAGTIRSLMARHNCLRLAAALCLRCCGMVCPKVLQRRSRLRRG